MVQDRRYLQWGPSCQDLLGSPGHKTLVKQELNMLCCCVTLCVNDKNQLPHVHIKVSAECKQSHDQQEEISAAAGARAHFVARVKMS